MSAGAGVGAGRHALLSVRGLRKDFPVRSGLFRRTSGDVRAVAGIDLDVDRGETVGLVGESGSGKSTLARLVTRLIEPTAGSVVFDGTELTSLSPRELRDVRRDLQMVFQDPYSSLDPRRTVAEAVGEPLEVHEGLRGADRDRRVADLMTRVGLDAAALGRYPHEFSGGQRQRIAIARALALDPRLLVCDEPVSSLDVSTQSQVLNLLARLRDELGLAYLFISHDLSVVRHLSHRTAVMYLGQIVEVGPTEDVHRAPRHPYTEALLSAIPQPRPRRRDHRRRITLRGDPPSASAPPPGCAFHPRCPYAMDVCRSVDPPPFTAPDGAVVRCHLHTAGPMLKGRSVGEHAEKHA